MSWQVGWLAQIGLYDDCYALCLPLVYSVVGGPRGGYFCRSGVLYYIGEGFVGRVCVFGSGNGEQTYPGLWFLPVWHGGIPDSLLLLVVFLVPFGAATHCFFYFVCAVGGFLVFLEFGFFFRFCSFLGLLKLAGSGGVGGHRCWGRLMPVGLLPGSLRMFGGISFVSCSFFCYSWPLGHREA